MGFTGNIELALKGLYINLVGRFYNMSPVSQFIFIAFLVIAFCIGICEEEDEETQARKRREAYRRGE